MAEAVQRQHTHSMITSAMTSMILVVIVASITCLALAKWWVAKSFVAKMKLKNRYIAWIDLQPFLVDGIGTLIVNRTNVPGAIWWSEIEVSDVELIPSLLFSAKLTTVPRRMRKLSVLRTEFPRATIRIASGSVRR